MFRFEPATYRFGRFYGGHHKKNGPKVPKLIQKQVAFWV